MLFNNFDCVDASENTQQVSSSGNKVDNIQTQINTSSSSNSNLISPSTKSGGSEALRILEGLKSRPKTYRGYNVLNTPNPNESINQDNISDSNSLSSAR